MKKFLPKKLWLLRAYVSFLIGFTELLLSLYVIISIINFFSRKTLLGDIVLGLGGLYLVAVSLSILLIAQIILLFIGIHDNIDDMRKKALDESFTVDLVAEKEKENSNIIHSVFLIAVIVLSILFSILSLTGESTPFSPNEYINHSQNNVIENNNIQSDNKTAEEKIIGIPINISQIVDIHSLPNGVYEFEIAQYDFPTELNWDDAIKACDALGKDWRLPSKEELNILREYRGVIGGFSIFGYFSSNSDPSNNQLAWVVEFNVQSDNMHSKENTYRIRAVRGTSGH